MRTTMVFADWVLLATLLLEVVAIFTLMAWVGTQDLGDW